MLARLAENLFWAGRYVERAEDTARMVDVTYHTLLESPQGRVSQSWEQLLEVLHLQELYGDGPIEPERAVEFLVIDRDNPGSIAAFITRARENVRSVRELVSSELWESVNELHLTLRSRDMRKELLDQPFQLLRWIRRDCMTIYGVASETMPRDDVWRFMAVHRSVAGLEFRAGTTQVGTPVDDVLTAGAGVCQDFAHLAIAMYRHLGIPARYVSGYLFTVDDSTGEDSDTDEVEVETHAWVEAALPGWGWLALDPTNAQAVGERHVTIGRGRDYDDVSPFRGVFTGRQHHELDVAVTMRRLALEPLGDIPGGFMRQVAQQQ